MHLLYALYSCIISYLDSITGANVKIKGRVCQIGWNEIRLLCTVMSVYIRLMRLV